MWFKVCDSIVTHPKRMKTSYAAIGLWTVLGAWCARHLTDGHIPSAVLDSFDPSRGLVDELVKNGWLISAEISGYELTIHDYLVYQPSKERVADISLKRSEAGKLGGLSKKSTKGTGTGTNKSGGKVRRVFEFWQDDTGHKNSRLVDSRARRIRARLNEGYSVDELCQAIHNRRNDPWLMGQDGSPRVYDGIETLLRDGAQVERLRDLSAPHSSGSTAPYRKELS